MENQEHYDVLNLAQAVLNDLISNDREDILQVLQAIPEWNQLVDKLDDIDYFFIGEEE